MIPKLLSSRSTRLLIVALSAFFQLNAQDIDSSLERYINSPSFSASGMWNHKHVTRFYNENQYRFCWLKDQRNKDIIILREFILQSEKFGLNREDYQPSAFANYPMAINTKSDSLLTETRFTDAALHFLHDVLLGNRTEPVSYNGLNYSPDCFNIPEVLNAYLKTGKFGLILDELESKQAEYLSVKTKLNLYLDKISALNFKDIKISSGKVNINNKPLITRLFQLGLIQSENANPDDLALKEIVKAAQDQFGLLKDGVLRSTIIQAMNVPLTTRIIELKELLNSLRWLICIKQQSHIIVVNIPSATLLVYEHGKVVLESKIIVGKKSTPTPTLCSKVSEVILYPYWNVPYKIATRELLPAIRRNIGYLDKHGYQVLNNQGKVMNPYHINWGSLCPSYFPYVIRQSTGCDNALGLIKLNFYNPFSVYLHDTPGKSLFSMNKRYFSHGCMRMEKAMEVGHYVLRNNKIAIDTLTQKGCLVNQSPISVPASEKIPVFVLYHTAWIDSSAFIRFQDDIYNKRRK